MPILGKSEKKTEEERQGSADDDKGATAPGDHDGATAGSSMAESAGKGDQGQDGERPSFRRDFLDEDGPERTAATAATAAPPPPPRIKGDVFFVAVAKEGGIDVHRFEDPTETQAFVEQLLEQGVPAEEVTAYTGFQLEFKVRHRPVVRLVSE